MPDSWDAGTYRKRAQQWRDKAQALPAGQDRDACMTLADGYQKLANLIDSDADAIQPLRCFADLVGTCAGDPQHPKRNEVVARHRRRHL